MWTILIIAVCIGMNAFLSAVEIAYVSIRKSLVKLRAKQGDLNAKDLQELLKNPEKTLSTIQIGITLLGAVTGAVGGAAAGLKIIPLFTETLRLNPSVAEIIAIMVVVLPITYLSVVLGEITPKALAIKNPYLFATRGVTVINILSNIQQKWLGEILL